MRSLNNYIIEKFQVSVDSIKNVKYAYEPKDKDELIACITDKIEKKGLGTEDDPLDLNDIDTSKITDMSDLFNTFYRRLSELSQKGYFNVSDWDVSNVTDMRRMFMQSGFDGDLSGWDVSNVTRMEYMFYGSNFTGENGDISGWDVSGVTKMKSMFAGSNFDTDLSNWDVGNVEDIYGMFTNCPLQKNPPKWYL